MNDTSNLDLHDLYDAAVLWSAAGCCVIPARSDGTKAPAVRWTDYQHAPPTDDQLREWFASGGPARYDGLGVVCGSVSGQLEMLEFEGRAIGLLPAFTQLLDDNGAHDLWTATTAGYSEVTPSGGVHLLYRVSGVDGATARQNTKLARRPSTDAELATWKTAEQHAIDILDAPGEVKAKRQAALDRIQYGWQRPQVLIETRGEGGYVVTWPSGGRTHETGKAWNLASGGPGSIAVISADDRDLLYWAASQFDTMPAMQPEQPGSQANNDAQGNGGWRPAGDIRAGEPGEPGELRPGDDYNLRASWDEILQPHGWKRARKSFHGPGAAWTRPGKEHGVSATTGRAVAAGLSGSSDEGLDRLYVFSTSTTFETERPYSKFAAFAHLEHGGNHSAAAAELRSRGYGTPHGATTIPTGSTGSTSPAGKLGFAGPQTSTPKAVEGQPDSDSDPDPQRTPSGSTGHPPDGVRPDLQLVKGGQGGNGAGNASNAGNAASAPAQPPGQRTSLDQSEDGHASRLIAAYGDRIRFCPQRVLWLVWDGSAWRWQPKGGGEVREYAKDVARDYPTRSAAETSWKKRALTSHGITGALATAQTDHRVVVPVTELDADPWTLNTPGGIVDLRNGVLLAPDPRRLCTKMTTATPDWDPSAGPLWERFLTDVFADDHEMRAYMQRLFGVSLIGVVLEQMLPFMHGRTGSNGKSTMIEAIAHALGTGEAGYARAASVEMLMVRKHEAHPSEIAALSGIRLVWTAELEEGQRFAEGQIKRLTGRDSLDARYLYGEKFTFKPSHTLWIVGNQKPRVHVGGDAFWRRVKLLSFHRVITNPDPMMGEKLQGEAGAILAWAIRGTVDYLRHGIQTPDRVKAATEEYEIEQDSLGRFVAEMLFVKPPLRIAVSDLRQQYEAWCNDTGDRPIPHRRMTQELRDRWGVMPIKSNGKRWYDGCALQVDDPTLEESNQRDEYWR